MSEPGNVQKTALRVTRWVGSPASVVIHSILFIVSFGLAFSGLISFDRMLLILTTIVSLEAIYLAIFIQMTLNYTTESLESVERDIDEMQEDVEEIQEDIDELQEDVEDISEDVEDISEEDAEEERAEAEQQKRLSDIQRDLGKLVDDIAKLQNK